LFDISVIQQNWPLFWNGLLVTLFYSAISIAAGLVIGLVVGLIQLTGSRALSVLGRVYVEIFRNIPLLVILLWIYYAFPIFAGLAVTKFWAGFAGLSLYAGAFYAEILRAGVQSIDKGQTDASTALGMTYGQRMRRVILPQAFRRMIPPFVNESVSILKFSSLVSVLGVADLTYQATVLSTTSFRPIEIFTFIAMVYLVLCSTLSYFARRLELRLAVSD
jgi:polar amino acid transport system permease protein